ncbi:tryptophan--tRNA ligase [Thermoproteus tenax]|uniref:Tryptophan--tRNA ligase n=1 Tax=Thermoproteus tenax (strain ATCC 35583 / DSM 2078 / JCM 9277 / NBRC 100435 / Kra 1) TaxID=768679 RepID=G4RMV4_THETK|nr:tryptophan--tRNA ligase [Thermoproteus tenax]CCC80898.1 Tryptophanyl-tRNA synthetase [Thermoproteus tenax Kra 1]
MDFVVTPWEVKGKVDYDKLLQQFGARPLTSDQISLLNKYAGEVHPLIRRGFFYAHRDFDEILKWHAQGRPWALYTGRGPSGPVHIGHMVPWILLKWFSDKFGLEVYFQMTDDEKFYDDPELSLRDTTRWAYENALDVIALGFEPDRLHLIVDTLDIKPLYPIAVKVAKKLTWNTVKATFGFTDSSNIGLIFYPSLQIAVAFLPTELRGETTPVLIPCAIDQDPYFRLARDIADGLGYPKPATLYSKFIMALTGESKMSASNPESAIYTVDEPKAVKRKIMNAFTGGRPTAEEQRKLGGNPDICPVFHYHMLLDPDDASVEKIRQDCRSGALLCGECKLRLYEKIERFLKEHKERREKAKDRVDEYRLSVKLDIKK